VERYSETPQDIGVAIGREIYDAILVLMRNRKVVGRIRECNGQREIADRKWKIHDPGEGGPGAQPLKSAEEQRTFHCHDDIGGWCD